MNPNQMICKRCGTECEGSSHKLSPTICVSCSEIVDGELETLIRQSVEMQTVFDNLFPSVVQELETVA